MSGDVAHGPAGAQAGLGPLALVQPGEHVRRPPPFCVHQREQVILTHSPNRRRPQDLDGEPIDRGQAQVIAHLDVALAARRLDPQITRRLDAVLGDGEALEPRLDAL